MVDCEFNSMLGRYHDGELPEDRRAIFEAHLLHCPRCAAELEQMQAISQSLGAAVLPRASGEFIARLEALAAHVEDAAVIRFARRLTAAAAAIVIASAAVQWTFHRAAAPVAPAVSPGSVVLSPDERMVIDPESAVSANPADATTAADLQVDFVIPGDPQ